MMDRRGGDDIREQVALSRVSARTPFRSGTTPLAVLGRERGCSGASTAASGGRGSPI
jgi:hypothetical protein